MKKVFLVGYSGVYTHKEFSVEGDVIIGRNSSVSQLVYPGTEKNISGMHCKVQNHGGNITLMDLGSTNGTFLQNGERLSPNVPYTLQQGESFYLGDKSNMFTIKVVEEAVPIPSAASIVPQAAMQSDHAAPQANGTRNNKKMTVMIAATAVVAGLVIIVAAISINNTNQAAKEETWRAEQEAEKARQDAERAQQELDEEQNKGKIDKTIDAIESWLE